MQEDKTILVYVTKKTIQNLQKYFKAKLGVLRKQIHRVNTKRTSSSLRLLFHSHLKPV